jgi:hypothetical protein
MPRSGFQVRPESMLLYTYALLAAKTIVVKSLLAAIERQEIVPGKDLM